MTLAGGRQEGWVRGLWKIGKTFTLSESKIATDPLKTEAGLHKCVQQTTVMVSLIFKIA